MKRKSLTEWIREHRAEIDSYIQDVAPGCGQNDNERREWVMNDEGLYNWARSEGVAI